MIIRNKRFFIALICLTFLVSILNHGQTQAILLADEFDVVVDTRNNWRLFDSYRIYAYSRYHGSSEVVLSFELIMYDGIINKTLYFYPSIELNTSINVFSIPKDVIFNNTGIYEIYLKAVLVSTGKELYGYDWIEIFAFSGGFWSSNPSSAYVHEPTYAEYFIDYKAATPRNLSVSLILNEEISGKGKNRTLYISPEIHFSGGNELFTKIVNITFNETGSYLIWCLIEDHLTGQILYDGYNIFSYWLKLNIDSQLGWDIFVENNTRINFEIFCSINRSIEVDIYVFLFNYLDKSNQTIYMLKNTPLDGSITRAHFNNSFIIGNLEKGYYDVDLKVIDKQNAEISIAGRYLRVFKEISLFIHQNSVTDVYQSEWISFQIYYFKSANATATVELLLDDGKTNITLFYNHSIPFLGKDPHSYEYDEFSRSLTYIFEKGGFYDVWLIMTIHETGEIVTEHCWFDVEGYTTYTTESEETDQTSESSSSVPETHIITPGFAEPFLILLPLIFTCTISRFLKKR